MDYPGLNAKAMTDDQLMNKIAELHGKLCYAFNFSNSGELVEQMQWMLETLQAEQHERLAKKAWDEQQRKQPSVIETDPDLVEKKKDDDLPAKKKAGIKQGGGSLLKRSRTPTAGGTTDL